MNKIEFLCSILGIFEEDVDFVLDKINKAPNDAWLLEELEESFYDKRIECDFQGIIELTLLWEFDAFLIDSEDEVRKALGVSADVDLSEYLYRHNMYSFDGEGKFTELEFENKKLQTLFDNRGGG